MTLCVLLVEFSFLMCGTLWALNKKQACVWWFKLLPFGGCLVYGGCCIVLAFTNEYCNEVDV
jgi:hypothetical protein